MTTNLDNTPERSQLGRASAYADRYDPSLLFPIPRATQREAMGLRGDALPFFGADLWTAFELSWLNARGRPQVAIAHITVPCETPHIIESKSFKLYLNSFNHSVFADAEPVEVLAQAGIAVVVAHHAIAGLDQPPHQAVGPGDELHAQAHDQQHGGQVFPAGVLDLDVDAVGAYLHVNSLSRSHFVATHFSPASTGAPPCSVRVAGSGRS
jgi:NADPH-dependent 7-cyano-7-deazaguanine reductase QueF-like protein